LGESIRGFKKAISTDEPDSHKSEEPRRIEEKRTPSADEESESRKKTEERR